MIETPLFLQSADPLDPIEYAADDFRRLLDALLPAEGVVRPSAGGGLVTQRAAGTNMSVDVAAGLVVVVGDDAAGQGRYLVPITVAENVIIPAAPGANSRIDSIVLRVRDPQAGGDPGEDGILEVVSGAAAAVPVAPAIPDTATELARVTVAAGTLAITNAMVTDRRFRGASELAGSAAMVEKLIGEESTTSATYVALATPVAMSAVIGASGMAIVGLSGQVRNSGAAGVDSILGLALSGANVAAATDASSLSLLSRHATTDYERAGRVALLTGLNPGLTTFTEQAKVTGGTGQFYNRHYFVIPL